MLFPVAVRGAVCIRKPLPQEKLDTLLFNLHMALLQEDARQIRVHGNQISFKAGLMTGPGWALLVPISRGSLAVSIEPKRVLVRYKLWFTQLLVASLIASLVFSLVGEDCPLGGTSAGIFAFCVLFFGNWVLTLVRFRTFLYRVVSRALA